jgi:hypothetical protein
MFNLSISRLAPLERQAWPWQPKMETATELGARLGIPPDSNVLCHTTLKFIPTIP